MRQSWMSKDGSVMENKLLNFTLLIYTALVFEMRGLY